MSNSKVTPELKTYTVLAKMSSVLTTFVEAYSLDEATEKAKKEDGANFSEVENSGSWEILDVVEDEVNGV